MISKKEENTVCKITQITVWNNTAVFFFIFRYVTQLSLWDPGWSLTLSSDELQRALSHWFPSCHSTVSQQVGQKEAAAAAMTVTYSRRVADAGLGTFFNLLLRWKGSIYKLLYRELIIFTVLYSFFSVVYRYSLWPNTLNSTGCF